MAFLVLLFIVLPIAELYVIIKVDEAIGILPTLALLIVDSFVGAALARSQGRAAWRRLNQALAAGRPPAREVADGAMILLGGALLLTPGFITDVVGLSLLLPPTRALYRAWLRRMASGHVTVNVGGRRAPDGNGHHAGAAWDWPRETPGYDYEGSAREVTDPPGELPSAGPDD